MNHLLYDQRLKLEENPVEMYWLTVNTYHNF